LKNKLYFFFFFSFKSIGEDNTNVGWSQAFIAL